MSKKQQVMAQEREWQKKQADRLAREEGPAKRTWSRHDLRHIKPRTDRQREAMEAFIANGDDVALLGSAGTGKTLLALYLAANELVSGGDIEHIVIVRAPVQAVDQGFLPGTLEEKQAPYEAPYGPLLAKLFGHATTYERMKEAGILQFVTPSFMRGTTIDNSVIILEEVQNCSIEHIDTVVTRTGDTSRLVVTGDTRQMDLNRTHGFSSGVQEFIEVSRNMRGFSIVNFTVHDIVRGPRVKSWVAAREQLWASRQLPKAA